jgi:hypothetical protein
VRKAGRSSPMTQAWAPFLAKGVKVWGVHSCAHRQRPRASQKDCRACELKSRCCPNMPSRNVQRSVHEEARDHARQLAGTPEYQRSRNERKKVEMLFAHLQTTMRFERMRLRGPTGARDEFHLAAIAQNLRRMARLNAVAPT